MKFFERKVQNGGYDPNIHNPTTYQHLDSLASTRRKPNFMSRITNRMMGNSSIKVRLTELEKEKKLLESQLNNEKIRRIHASQETKKCQEELKDIISKVSDGGKRKLTKKRRPTKRRRLTKKRRLIKIKKPTKRRRTTKRRLTKNRRPIKRRTHTKRRR